MYILGFEQTDTLSAGGAGLSHTGTAATLSSGSFGTPAGTQILCVDYSNALAAYFTCTVAGTALNGISFIGGNVGADHAAGAPVASVFTPAHHQALADGTGWAATAVRQSVQSTGSGQTLGASFADVTGLIASVTVPAGGRSVRTTFSGTLQQNVDGNSVVTVQFMRDGTTLKSKSVHVTVGGIALSYTLIHDDPAPTSGSHTYKLQANYTGGGAAPFVSAGSSMYVDLF